MTAVELEHLSFAYDSRPILAGLCASITAGEHVVLIGPNGAGKSTLLKCLNGLLPTAPGSVRLFGRPLARYRQRELAATAGYVPQNNGAAIPFTVGEFVLMGRYPHQGMFTSVTNEDVRIAREALALTGAAEYWGRRLGTLSGGERQKVYIAAALAQQPKVLLLDEPTSFLDYRHRDEIHRLLDRIHRQEGMTIVTVTHDVNTAAVLGARVWALVEGRIAIDGPADEVIAAPVLEAVFHTRFELARHPASGRPLVVPCEVRR